MKKVTVISSVVNGTLQRNRNTLLRAIQSFEGKTVEIAIRIATNRRSNSQNAYYWGVVVPLIQEALFNTWGEVRGKDFTHEFLKANCGFKEVVNEETGEIIRVPKSTTENTTTEQELYHDACRQLAQEFFNVTIPLPNEELTLEV